MAEVVSESTPLTGVIPRKPTILRRAFWFLMPSFIANYFNPAQDEQVAPPKLLPTSYLNSLRGIASLIVVFQHNSSEYFESNYRGWGDQADDHHIIQLPFVRVLVSGGFMVALFFVISGFSLAYGPLERICRGDADAAIGSLPSSLFRRPFRLFLPAVPVVIICTIMRRFEVLYGHQQRKPIPFTSEPGMLGLLIATWRGFMAVIRVEGDALDKLQLWTLSIEFQGSLVVFLCCLAFARTSPNVRIFCIFLLAIFYMGLSLWPLALFLAGMILAEMRLRRRVTEWSGLCRTAATISWWTLFIASLFFGGWPTHGNVGSTFAFRYFNWIPTGPVVRPRFWQSLSAVLMLTALEHVPLLQGLLNSSCLLYLGEISYSLYLIHWVIAQNSATRGSILAATKAGYQPMVAWAAVVAIVIPLCIWAADIYWRLVDQQCVRYSRWLARKLCI